MIAFDFGEAYRGEIYAIYLLDEFKRHGIGKTLLNYINRHLKQHLLTPYVTWVLEENKTACQFYEKYFNKRRWQLRHWR